MVLKKINHIVTSHGVINHRMIVISLKANPININMIQKYALTSDADEDELQKFCGVLADTDNSCQEGRSRVYWRL